MDLKHRLTVLTAKLLGGYVDKRTYEYEGYRDEVYVFSGPKVAGMSVFWVDILLNERIFEEEKKELLQNVFHHEKGHQEEKRVLQALHSGIRYLIAPWAFALHLVLLGTSAYLNF